jgi:hypothetical protein
LSTRGQAVRDVLADEQVPIFQLSHNSKNITVEGAIVPLDEVPVGAPSLFRNLLFQNEENLLQLNRRPKVPARSGKYSQREKLSRG